MDRTSTLGALAVALTLAGCGGDEATTGAGGTGGGLGAGGAPFESTSSTSTGFTPDSCIEFAESIAGTYAACDVPRQPPDVVPDGACTEEAAAIAECVSLLVDETPCAGLSGENAEDEQVYATGLEACSPEFGGAGGGASTTGAGGVGGTGGV